MENPFELPFRLRAELESKSRELEEIEEEVRDLFLNFPEVTGRQDLEIEQDFRTVVLEVQALELWAYNESTPENRPALNAAVSKNFKHVFFIFPSCCNK